MHHIRVIYDKVSEVDIGRHVTRRIAIKVSGEAKLNHFSCSLPILQGMASGDEIESLVLRRHAKLFVQCPDCTPLLGVLRANDVINEMEYQRISAKQTTIEKNGYVRLI